jgi:hypothetical protein
VTWQKLGRILGERLRVVRVMEYQRRGLVHVHALVIGTLTRADLALVVSGGINPRTGRRIQPARHGAWSWGPSCDAQPVPPGADGRIGAYMTKVVGYAVKSAGEGMPSGSHAERMAEAGARSCRCAHPSPDCCDGAPVSVFTRDDGSTYGVAWQTPAAELPCRRHRLARNGWGYRGHVFAASRNWGTTFMELRAKRAAWHGGRKDADATHIVAWERMPQQTRRVLTSAVRRPGAARPLDSVEQVVTPGLREESPAPPCASPRTPHRDPRRNTPTRPRRP